MLFMEVFKVWAPLRGHPSVQALYGAKIALHWKISERQKSTHSAFVKHQYINPPYISSLKIIGLEHFLKILGPSEENYNPQSL